MAPQAKVSVVDTVNAIKKFMLNFTTNELPAYTVEVWKLMSYEMKGQWSAHNFYINVREDRRNVLSLARYELGIVISTDESQTNEAANMSGSMCNSDCSNDHAVDKDSSDDLKRNRVQNFKLLLTEEEWAKIKPIQEGAGKLCLTPSVWTNVVSLAFWRLYKLPCAFVYKRADVTAATSNPNEDTEKEDSDDVTSIGFPCDSDGPPATRLPITHLIKIVGQCRSKECGNLFTAKAEFNLDDKAVMFHIRTLDTRTDQHEEVKRPFNGMRRKEAYRALITEGAAVWRRRQARENMVEGDIEPPFIPSGNVLREVKKEATDSLLDVKSTDGRDLIKTLEEMSLKPEFRSLIHAVSSLPFYVFYMNAAQLHAYKEYCRLNRSDCTISIDATGSLVQKLNRPGGGRSGHKFLYVIVINFEKSALPVYQMLSEKHETELIEFWLKKWIRLGAPKPKEAVCDYSRALISALCLAFNNVTVKSYVNNCFARLSGLHHQAVAYPATLIRIDVSHLIHPVCRWKSLKTVTHQQVKEFYVRCVVLMVDSHSLAEFENIFLLTCSVGLQVHEDTEIDKSFSKPERHCRTARDARKLLESYISDRSVEVGAQVDQSDAKIRTEMDDTRDFIEHTTSGGMIGQWIDKLVSTGKGCGSDGTDLNPFYLPDFIISLAKLAKEFPLWTAVMVPSKAQHATSSYIESYFGFLKKMSANNFDCLFASRSF